MSEDRALYDAGRESSEGWAVPIGTTFAHYFVDGKSLCDRWRWRGELEPIDRVTPHDCVMCLHELIKRLRLQVEQLAEALELALE